VKHRWSLAVLAWLVACGAHADGIPGPQPAPLPPPIAAPRDVAFPGVIEVSVDATDSARRIFRVHETVPVPAGSDLVLLYPKWLPGAHAPEGPLDRLAGLVVSAGGRPMEWTRDVVDAYAFHVAVPAGTKAVDLEFEYLSPVSHAVGPTEVTPNLLVLDWNAVVLYPAGYFARRIPIDVRLTLPIGWSPGTALEIASAEPPVTTFRQVSLETLIDSPVRAGRYLERYDLATGDATPVHLDLLAERPDLVAIKPQVFEPLRALVQQAYRLFGSRHYDHYDFLVSLSDTIGWDTTLEHHRSAEYGEPAADFADWDKTAGYRDVIAHEYVHSWNGKFRRPADLWTPNFNVPMRDSLLWVYEGGTEYWGKVLTARAGLWTRQQALDAFAMMIAALQQTKGRSWRALQDTTNDEIINPRHPISWRSWQRFEDYYQEGALIWLDADTLIRERSKGARSLDDFARAFFGVDDGSYTPVVYTFEDVVKALNAIEPYEWATFLRTRLDGHPAGPPLDGLRRGGYKLVFTETPSEYWTGVETTRTRKTDLSYSLGLAVDKEGVVASVTWDSPAFEAGLTAGTRLVAVNGIAFDPDKLREAITLAKGQSAPIELLVRDDDRFRQARVDYHGGLRYPHLERDPSQPARLDGILAPRR
jgi:predicted metalloprotease with PDZ domain